MKKIFIIALLITTYHIGAVAATNKDLSAIQSQIQTIQQDIKQQQASRDQAQQTLQQTETQLGELTKLQQHTAAQQKQQKATLKTLNQKQAEYEKNLEVQQTELAHQIRLAYMLGQQEFIKLLLSQENPSQTSRNLMYYQYLTRAQLATIEQSTVALQQVIDNKQAIEQHTAQLLALQNQQQQQLQAIKIKHSEREASLKQLNGMLSNKSQQLQKLLADKAALERAIKQAAQTAAASQSVGGPIVWPSGGSFAKAQGKLSWPTRGTVTAGFNSPIEGSEIKLAGVLIAAPEGQSVYAIAPGRVVFADWMSGYGLLMIVDHGQGYMTLYGRNGALYKQVGDTVIPGERIATVGKTGGYAQPSLYFAIRQQAEPLNPALWCR